MSRFAVNDRVRVAHKPPFINGTASDWWPREVEVGLVGFVVATSERGAKISTAGGLWWWMMNEWLEAV